MAQLMTVETVEKLINSIHAQIVELRVIRNYYSDVRTFEEAVTAQALYSELKHSEPMLFADTNEAHPYDFANIFNVNQ